MNEIRCGKIITLKILIFCVVKHEIYFPPVLYFAISLPITLFIKWCYLNALNKWKEKKKKKRKKEKKKKKKKRKKEKEEKRKKETIRYFTSSINVYSSFIKYSLWFIIFNFETAVFYFIKWLIKVNGKIIN